jgi:hypothetical protein
MREAVVLTVLLFLLASCSSPDEQEIARDFVKERAQAKIVSITVGDGDDSHAYMHIRYATDGSSDLCEVVWGYRRTGNAWSRFSTSDAEPIGPVAVPCQ